MTCKYKIKKIVVSVFFILVLTFTTSAETIEKIVIEGNKNVSRDTILFYMKSQEKGAYSKSALRNDFKSLWKTGFFEDISIEAADGQDGKIVKLIVKENLLISSITYKTGKKIKKDDIVDRLQENNIVLAAFSYYNPAKLKKVEGIIKELLLEKGYNEGKVSLVTKKDEVKRQVAVTIQVVKGPKTRIGAIMFPGLDTRAVSPSFLRKGMKHNKSHSLLSLLGKKDVYNKDKVTEDLEAIKLRLQQKGYLEAKVGTPTVSLYRKQTVFGKVQKMLRIAIPVETGPQYRVGDIKIEGNTILETDFLKGLVTLKKGRVYNIKKRNKILETIQAAYGSLGYIFSQVAPVENLDPVANVADLTLNIREGEMAYVGKLEFKGNTFTRDHVIRREWLLKEGDRFNTGWLKACITRMRQLGLVDIAKEPEFKPNPEDPQKMDINVKVKEINRQRVNFNLGYNALEGWFVGLQYSTHNFMGLGEMLAVTLQTGTRSKQYRLAFTEPYLLNLPVNLGFDLHKTAVSYPDLYTRKGKGFSISASGRIRRFFGASLSYSYEDVEAGDINEDLIFSNPIYLSYYQRGKISALSPTIFYSTVDSPIFPTSGSKYLFNYRYSGGILGGDVNLHKTRLQLVKFIPVGKRHILGMQLVHEAILPFGGQVVPIYERFFLGGERSIRGFDIYQVSPRDADGSPIGGNKAFHLNLEYIIPLNQQFSAVLFYDVGNVYDFGVPISLKDVYSSMGLELKLFVPMLNVPFRLIFAYNPRTLHEEDSNFVFRFAIGPSFQ